MAEPSTKQPHPLFRQESLERLSSPERLDELMPIVSLRRWLPLATMALLLGVGATWGWWGRIPVTAQASGVLVQGEDGTPVAFLSVAGRYRGRIQPGMTVALMPDPLADLSHPPLMAAVQAVVSGQPLTLAAVRDQPATAALRDPDPLDLIVPLPETAVPAAMVAPGVGVEGRITLAEKRPLSFVLPFLESP
ncbi:hypothetical protein [Nodosilinea sp. P-1105]|uniref:hypothetical protein n=1 Tax=Nodosilinea sp. P-1105 TaxID=2546229 RepID=UPI00146F819E|nr:hypothetical protein [Nodosilinea sp. P-1105]NMF84253.1 hypothetical protein [Nodosilinea sp. P-1105]